MRLADRSTSLKTQQVAGPCRAKVKLPAEPVVIITKDLGHVKDSLFILTICGFINMKANLFFWTGMEKY